jgi:hypothetical protein
VNHDFNAGLLTGRATLFRQFAMAFRRVGDFDSANACEEQLLDLYERSDPLTMILAHERVDCMRWFDRLNPHLQRNIAHFQSAVIDQDWGEAAYYARRLKQEAVTPWA